MLQGKKWVSFVAVLEGVKTLRIMERVKGIDRSWSGLLETVKVI